MEHIQTTRLATQNLKPEASTPSHSLSFSLSLPNEYKQPKQHSHHFLYEPRFTHLTFLKIEIYCMPTLATNRRLEGWRHRCRGAVAAQAAIPYYSLICIHVIQCTIDIFLLWWSRYQNSVASQFTVELSCSIMQKEVCSKCCCVLVSISMCIFVSRSINQFFNITNHKH